MSKLSKEFKSGFIFLLAIVTLVYGLKYLKGLNVFQTNKPYYAIYSDIDGLQVGSSIRLNGFNVGIINDIQLHSENNLIVTLNIDKLDKKHTFYKIIFNGSSSNFINIMKNKNYLFDIQKKIWILK